MLLTVGVSHKTAPIDVREKVAFSQEHIPCALKTLACDLALEEVALLSTCNRTEFYFSAPMTEPFVFKRICSWWQDYCATPFDMNPYLYTLSDTKAVKHIMRVASGLDSMIMGEPQILGQLKTAFRIASQSGMLGTRLSKLFQTSFSVAKKVRHTTGIALHPVSVAYAAVTLAKQIFSDLRQATVVLIGAGETIELTLQHLLAKDVKRIFILNRTLSHAENLAAKYHVHALSLTELPYALTQADVVISSIASSQPLLTQAHVDMTFKHCKRRPIFMVDLGVPRNIEPSISNNEDIYLYTVDDLQGIVTENLKLREEAALKAETLITSACEHYMQWVQSHRQLDAIRTLRQRVLDIKDDALNSALRQLENGNDPKEVLKDFAHRLTQKLMHQPTINLRRMSSDPKQEKIEIVKELFSIE